MKKILAFSLILILLAFSFKVFSQTYCYSGGSSTNLSIKTLQFNTINTTLTDTGYTDKTNLVTSLYPGTTYRLTLTKNTFVTWNFPTDCKVWIDYNHDGDFTDSNEYCGTAGALDKQPVLFDLKTPFHGITSDTTRMRIILMDYINYGYVNSCGAVGTGHTVDISVIFKPISGKDLRLHSLYSPEVYSTGNNNIALVLQNTGTDTIHACSVSYK